MSDASVCRARLRFPRQPAAILHGVEQGAHMTREQLNNAASSLSVVSCDLPCSIATGG